MLLFRGLLGPSVMSIGGVGGCGSRGRRSETLDVRYVSGVGQSECGAWNYERLRCANRNVVEGNSALDA